MARKISRKLSPAQNTYILAKAAYETAWAACNEAMQPHLALLETEEGIEEFSRLEEVAARQVDRYELAGLLREAEQVLIDWSFSVVARLPQYQAQAAELEKVRTSRNITIRAKLIDLAMRLEA